MNELKPCPFCGKSKLTQFRDEKYGITILCTRCGGRIATHINHEEAVLRWNQRKSEGVHDNQI